MGGQLEGFILGTGMCPMWVHMYPESFLFCTRCAAVSRKITIAQVAQPRHSWLLALSHLLSGLWCSWDIMYASLFLCFLDILSLLLREKGKDPTYIFYLCRLGSKMLQTTLFSQPIFFFVDGVYLLFLSVLSFLTFFVVMYLTKLVWLKTTRHTSIEPPRLRS